MDEYDFLSVIEVFARIDILMAKAGIVWTLDYTSEPGIAFAARVFSKGSPFVCRWAIHSDSIGVDIYRRDFFLSDLVFDFSLSESLIIVLKYSAGDEHWSMSYAKRSLEQAALDEWERAGLVGIDPQLAGLLDSIETRESLSQSVALEIIQTLSMSQLVQSVPRQSMIRAKVAS